MGMKLFTRKYFEKRLEIIKEQKLLALHYNQLEEANQYEKLEKEILEIMTKDPSEEWKILFM